MEAIAVTVPGHYKRLKTNDENRRCGRCGIVLSIYNPQDLCYTHQEN